MGARDEGTQLGGHGRVSSGLDEGGVDMSLKRDEDPVG